MTINPVTGQDPESHAASTVIGMAAARDARSKYIAGIISGEMKLADVIEYSKGQLNTDAKYLSALRLLDILKAKTGWNESSSVEALERNGFARSDNLKSIRRHPRRVTLFIELFDSPGERWKTRPETPTGWPWFGKLSALIEASGESVPSELLPQQLEVAEEDLNDLFGDEHETFDSDIDKLLGVE